MTLLESFPALDALPFLRACFLGKDETVDVTTDRQTALDRLASSHQEAQMRAGLGSLPVVTAEQIHGNAVAVVREATTHCEPSCDGLVTSLRGVVLSIAVADCAAVYLADRQGRGLALVHSGKKGTELGIVSKAISLLCETTGAEPGDLVMQISPCIRPPHYETDFAKTILSQAADAGVHDLHDCDICTASHTARYYSYRRDRGQTGRMLAMIALGLGEEPRHGRSCA